MYKLYIDSSDIISSKIGEILINNIPNQWVDKGDDYSLTPITVINIKKIINRDNTSFISDLKSAFSMIDCIKSYNNKILIFVASNDNCEEMNLLKTINNQIEGAHLNIVAPISQNTMPNYGAVRFDYHSLLSADSERILEKICVYIEKSRYLFPIDDEITISI